MTLDERLTRARNDYRSATEHLDQGDRTLDTAGIPPRTPNESRSGWSTKRRHRLLAAAAVVALIAATAGGLAVVDRDRGQDLDAAAPDAPGQPARLDQPIGATAQFDPAISLTPAGPYTDGQQVTVGVPEGYANDLINGGVRLCATVADAMGGPEESCDPDGPTVDPMSGTMTSITATIGRRVLTPDGYRDCDDSAVTCRLLVRHTSGEQRASGALEFEGGAPSPTTTLTVQPTGQPGRFVLDPDGLTPDPSWTEYRRDHPERGEESYPAFRVQVCAFDASARPEGPYGADLWGTTDDDPPAANCDSSAPTTTVDATDPDLPVELSIDIEFLGYGGWSDCRVDRCFVQIRRHTVQGESDQGLVGNDVTAVAAPLGIGADTPSPGRPSITITTPGPFTAGQTISVEVADLPEGFGTNIGVCNVGSPWSCGYLGIGDDVVDGTREITLPDTVAACGPQQCYLELNSKGEGLPPLATVPFDVAPL